ncbi:MAG: hypothetical protein CVT64_00430 [Actinobacteria bacterium HGW-Actinobacteria-4]|nr:MAG: hypothetical protein CVT64_00430 [Actinobacteria bacterium HGW-Actinobacteria-4]
MALCLDTRGLGLTVAFVGKTRSDVGVMDRLCELHDCGIEFGNRRGRVSDSGLRGRNLCLTWVVGGHSHGGGRHNSEGHAHQQRGDQGNNTACRQVHSRDHKTMLGPHTHHHVSLPDPTKRGHLLPMLPCLRYRQQGKYP